MKENTSHTVDMLHQKASGLLAEGMKEEDIISELIKEGISKDYAQTIIGNIESDISDKKEFRRLLIMGTFFIIAGLLINYLSYTLTIISNSFFFLLFWGIVVYGIILVHRAFSLFRK